MLTQWRADYGHEKEREEPPAEGGKRRERGREGSCS